MTNTHWPDSFHGEDLPEPDLGGGRYELVSTHVISDRDDRVDLQVDLLDDGTARTLRGGGRSGLAAFLDALHRGGIEVGVDREVSDWDGETSTVTSRVRCVIGEHELWSAGVARDRGDASMRAVVAACNRVAALVRS